MNLTDNELRALLAKMLTETVHLSHSGELCWSHNYSQDSHLFVRVIDTELLHLASLVEAGLTENQKCQYVVRLSTTDRENSHDWNMAFATWQQRTTALAEVKGDK